MTSTNLPNGVTNADSNSSMGTLTQLDPSKVYTYFNDFNLVYDSAEWSESTLGTIPNPRTLDEAGGVLELKSGIGQTDAIFLQLKNETFKFVSGKKFYFKARIKATTAILRAIFVIGLQIRSAFPFPLAVSDGVFFVKFSGSLDLEFHVEKNNVSSSATVGSVIDGTYIDVAFIYDGKSEVQYWYNDVKIGTLDTTNLPDDEELTVSLGLENGDGNVRTLDIDYIYVANER